jgi:hypothetical protein
MLAGMHTFDPATERRRGLRLPTRCWALLRGRERSIYARTVELSATGVVLEVVGRRHPMDFRATQRFELDLFVPGATTPIHVTVRPVRSVGSQEAFELVEASSVDRLTLAEHLDHLLAARRQRAGRPRVRRALGRRVSPGAAWKRLLLPSAAERAWAATAH